MLTRVEIIRVLTEANAQFDPEATLTQLRPLYDKAVNCATQNVNQKVESNRTIQQNKEQRLQLSDENFKRVLTDADVPFEPEATSSELKRLYDDFVNRAKQNKTNATDETNTNQQQTDGQRPMVQQEQTDEQRPSVQQQQTDGERDWHSQMEREEREFFEEKT